VGIAGPDGDGDSQGRGVDILRGIGKDGVEGRGSCGKAREVGADVADVAEDDKQGEEDNEGGGEARQDTHRARQGGGLGFVSRGEEGAGGHGEQRSDEGGQEAVDLDCLANHRVLRDNFSRGASPKSGGGGH